MNTVLSVGGHIGYLHTKGIVNVVLLYYIVVRCITAFPAIPRNLEDIGMDGAAAWMAIRTIVQAGAVVMINLVAPKNIIVSHNPYNIGIVPVQPVSIV